MKKIIPILLCVLLIGALVFSVSAEGSSVAITPSATTLERGDTFTIVATLNNTTEVNTGGVALSYDESVFELTGGNCNIEGVLFGQVGVKDKAGAFMLSTPTKLSGKIFTFNFKVKSDAALGTYTFTTTASIGLSTGSPITATGATITIACEHTFGNWTKLDDGIGKPAPTCEQGGTLEYTCLICHTTKTEAVGAVGHEWDNDCDTTCNNNCGKTREASHKYENTYSSDKNGHWYACSVCKDKKDFAAHIPGPAATEKNNQTCTVCQFEIAPILAHEHEMSTEWISDGKYHWHRCVKSGCYYVEDKVSHTYDNDCDVSCNVCSYIRDDAPHNYNEEWKANAEGHWCVCTACGAKSEVLPHVPGPEATETEPQLCEDCNFRIKMPLSHVHDYGENWYGDDTHHWQSCAECNEATPMEEHAWNEPVELGNGEMEYTCSICGKQVITSEPIQSQPATTPNTDISDKDAAGQEESGRFPWQWAGIAAIVLLVIGVVLLVIEFIRSRKTNMHGKFSK